MIHYDDIKAEFDTCTEEEKAELVQALNDWSEEFGDMFTDAKHMA